MRAVAVMARSIAPAAPAPEPGYRSVPVGTDDPATGPTPLFDIFVREDLADDPGLLADLDRGLAEINPKRIARGDRPFVRLGGVQ